MFLTILLLCILYCIRQQRNVYLYSIVFCLKTNKRIHISPVRGGAVSQLIAMKFGTLIELTYVIKFAKFCFDRPQGWGLVSTQILGFCFYLRSRT